MSTTTATQIATTDWHIVDIRSSQAGQTCDHCPRTLKNLYEVENIATGEKLTVGRGCCKKVTGWSLTIAQARQMLRAAETEKRQAAVWTEFTAQHPEGARTLEADIATWRPARPGQANIPMHVKRDIMRGATPRNFWTGRLNAYLDSRSA